MSLRARLLLALVPLFVLCLTAADAAVYADQQSFLYSQLQQQAGSGLQWVEASLLQGPASPPPGKPSAQAPPGAVWGEVLSASGAVVAGPQFFGLPEQDQLSATANHPALPSGLGSEIGGYLSVAGVGRFDRYLVHVAGAGPDGTSIAVAAVPTLTYDATLGNLLRLELVVGAVVVVVLVLAAWLIVRRGLRPLARMSATARAIAAGEVGRRVSPSTPSTEVGRLGLALNTMLDRLETALVQRAASERRLREFVSDASHELRTPLTSMRGYAELLRRTSEMQPEELEMALRRIEEEAQRMGLLVDDLLLLARLDQGRPLARSRVDLEALVADACAGARAGDPSRSVTLRVSAPLTVTGDEPRLHQVMANLLRNATVHTPAGTPVEVALREEDGRAVIEVADHGPGIAPEARGRVFERFHRADPELSRDQGGSGLGLSIVAAVVGAHGGRVGVSETSGGGATFRIELPLDAPPSPDPDR